jgi:hypothetical protein
MTYFIGHPNRCLRGGQVDFELPPLCLRRKLLSRLESGSAPGIIPCQALPQWFANRTIRGANPLTPLLPKFENHTLGHVTFLKPGLLAKRLSQRSGSPNLPLLQYRLTHMGCRSTLKLLA